MKNARSGMLVASRRRTTIAVAILRMRRGETKQLLSICIQPAEPNTTSNVLEVPIGTCGSLSSRTDPKQRGELPADRACGVTRRELG